MLNKSHKEFRPTWLLKAYDNNLTEPLQPISYNLSLFSSQKKKFPYKRQRVALYK